MVSHNLGKGRQAMRFYKVNGKEMYKSEVRHPLQGRYEISTAQWTDLAGRVEDNSYSTIVFLPNNTQLDFGLWSKSDALALHKLGIALANSGYRQSESQHSVRVDIEYVRKHYG